MIGVDASSHGDVFLMDSLIACDKDSVRLFGGGIAIDADHDPWLVFPVRLAACDLFGALADVIHDGLCSCFFLKGFAENADGVGDAGSAGVVYGNGLDA